MSDKLPFIIAGSGIGGIATALGLAEKGVKSIVLERAPELVEIVSESSSAPMLSTQLTNSASVMRRAHCVHRRCTSTFG
jgi:2-polyprenyl-6-methoxyphenol hydroxylase-like FAD-dependent oxidoreductase